MRTTFSFNLSRCSYYHRVLDLPRNKFQCCKLQQYLAQSKPECNNFFQLAVLKFVVWKVENLVVMRATTLFNLQCNNVARQVQRKCCPYYLAFICMLTRLTSVLPFECSIDEKRSSVLTLYSPLSLDRHLLTFYASINFNYFNHTNYNFLDCDWFKKLLFSTNSLAKLLSDSLLSDSLLLDSLLSDSSISQSYSKL